MDLLKSIIINIIIIIIIIMYLTSENKGVYSVVSNEMVPIQACDTASRKKCLSLLIRQRIGQIRDSHLTTQRDMMATFTNVI